MRFLTGLLFCTIFGLGFCPLYAQSGLGLGILAGANYSSYEYTGDEAVQNANYEPGFGYYAGAFVSIPVGVKLTFAPELIYSHQTATGTGDVSALLDELGISDDIPFEVSEDIKLDAQESLLLLPLMFRYKISRFDVGFGPQVGYSVSRKIEASSEEFNLTADVSDYYDEDEEDKFALNLNLDAGFYITNHLKLGARYSYGLLLRNEVRISVWQLGLSYGFL